MQYTTEIDSSCNFQVSKDNTETNAYGTMRKVTRTEFPWVSNSESMSKIGLHLPKL